MERKKGYIMNKAAFWRGKIWNEIITTETPKINLYTSSNSWKLGEDLII